MQSKEELYRAALLQTAEQRQHTVMQAQRQSEVIHRALPGLAPLEEAARVHGANAVMAAIQGDTAARAAELKAVSEAEAETARLLACAGYPEDALAPHYFCPKCKDTGVSDGHTCSCVLSRMRTLRREEINASSPLRLCGFDSFDLTRYPDAIDPALGGNLRVYMGKLLEYCKNYAETFPDFSGGQKSNLLFMGSAGLGKTRLALSIADTVLSRGYDVIYISAGELVSHLEREHFGGEGTVWMDAAKQAELLIFDDLGTEFLSSFSTSALYELINTRLLAGLATIYTTNITDNSVFESRYTEKIASRILGNCKIFKFFGQDQRVKASLKK